MILSGIVCELMGQFPYPIGAPLLISLLLISLRTKPSVEDAADGHIKKFIMLMAIFTTAYLHLSSSSLYFFGDSTIVYSYQAMYLLCVLLLIPTWKKSILFSLPIFLTLMAYKADIGRAVGHPVSGTDWKIIAELPVLLVIALTLLKSRYGILIKVSKQEATIFAVLTAFSLHFANYLYAGLSKVYIAGLSWVHNPTLNITRASVALEQNPVLDLMMQYFDIRGVLPIIEPFVTEANIAVLALQLLCILGLVFWRSLLLWLLLFDILHIAIFFFSGIFFYKWIFLNIALIAVVPVLVGAEKNITLRRYQNDSFAIGSPLLKIYAIVFCLLSGVFFYVPQLGWLDGKLVPRISVQLVNADGTKISVPSNFFLAQSVNFGQHRIPGVSTSPYRAFGAVRAENEFWECGRGPSFSSAVDLDAAQQFFKNAVAAINRVDATKGPLQVDHYPHHIWSNLRTDMSSSAASEAVSVKFSRDLLCVAGEVGDYEVIHSEWHEVHLDDNKERR